MDGASDDIQPAHGEASTVSGHATPAAGAAATIDPQPSHRARWREEWRFAGPIVGLALGIHALLMVFGVAFTQTLHNQQFSSVRDWLTLWNRWDALHYLELAEHGYQRAGDTMQFIVYFPGYPWAVALVNAVAPGGALTAAFALSGVAAVTATLLLAYLVRHDSGSRSQATRAAWFLLIFPTAYFLYVPYTESLFLTALLGSFLAARTGHWRTAGLVGALAALTRLSGVLLIPALAVEAYLQYRQTRRVDRAWAWIAAVAIGTLVYLGLNQHYFGNPFEFQEMQRTFWMRYLQDPYSSIKGMIGGYDGLKPGQRQTVVVQEVLFLGIGLVASVIAWWRLRPSYATWGLLNVLLFASTSWIQSTPRYALTLFPIVMLLAQFDGRSTWSKLASATSLMMLCWFAGLYVSGKWAF